MPSKPSSADNSNTFASHSHSQSHSHSVQPHRPGYDAQGNRLSDVLPPASPPRFHRQLRRVQSLKLKPSLQSFFPLPPVTEVVPADEEISEERVGSVESSKAHIVSGPQTSAAHRAVHALDWDFAQPGDRTSARVEQAASLGAVNHQHHHHQQEQEQNHQHHHHRKTEKEDYPPQDTHPAHRSDVNDMSHSHSSSMPSVFDDRGFDINQGEEEDMDEHYTDPTTPGGDPTSYDLKPPPPSQPLSNIELLADRLFSVDHLKLIIKDHTLHTRFASFLSKYRPHASQALQRYLEAQKAVAAVEYANAIAEHLVPGAVAALLEDGFEDSSRMAVDELINDALPGFITHRLVQIVTDTLVKEITGQNTPIMRELVAGLAEVYCLSDPSLPDNPIVYASEEFFRTSQYGKDYAIGRNCRFLQGPQTSGASVARLVEALSEGQEICETILNYRRDGSPFMNLLMIAPLYDNKGAVRYFIGAQVDINGLIEGGRGIDSFERLLAQDRHQARYGEAAMSKTPQAALGELSNMLNDDDMEIVRHSGREMTARRPSGASTPVTQAQRQTGRRYVGMDNPEDRNLWPAPSLGPSGRLPGVFQNYLLVRPYPSLRITFTSPALRIPGLLQSRFLDRIGGAPHIREGILSAMSSGVGVTAKVTWIPMSGEANSGRGSVSSRGHGNDRHTTAQDVDGRHRWIHCTPLIGSDEKVGVWMIVMVESENITGSIHAQAQQQQNLPDRSGHITSPVYASSSNKLYSQYLRREDRQDSMIGAVEHQFPRPGTSQTLNYNAAQAARGGDLSKQGSTRSRGTAADLGPQSPTFGHAPAQAAAGARRGSVQKGTSQQPEIRAGPYQGATAAGYHTHTHPSVRKPTGPAMSGMGSGNLTGAAAASYGPPPPPPPKEPTSMPFGAVHAISSPPRPGDRQTLIGGVDREMGREREVYERNRADKEQREGRARERAEVDEDAFRNFSS